MDFGNRLVSPSLTSVLHSLALQRLAISSAITPSTTPVPRTLRIPGNTTEIFEDIF